MFGSLFKGTGGVILAVGAVAVLLAIVGAGIAFSDEQDNRDQRCGIFFCDGPDRGRSEMNFGVMEAALMLGVLGLAAIVIGIFMVAFGGGVERHEDHRRRLEEARARRENQ